MGSPYLGEIRIMSSTVVPKGWARCEGQIMPINQNQALFSLMGTRYGGDGRVTFALPDLRGRVPIHMGLGHVQGERGGAAEHTLSSSELPGHNHRLSMSSALANSGAPSGALPGRKGRLGRDLFAAASNTVALNSQAVAPVGDSQAHQNMQPSLVLNFCIALQGIFPSRN
ncbi:phage tail protein [Rugamonas sp. CCM 8940]|uniref:phage tail protein n=1 Tax=Rugamonas sp. CCM 8940 TaxID=2765359 RepID=UPI0018F591E6|nr:tail fiber protein [Rugamonas sp. CCM 8940]MBJ7309365.1 phage tail protein [Rugamonas sp. CCM 8940]